MKSDSIWIVIGRCGLELPQDRRSVVMDALLYVELSLECVCASIENQCGGSLPEPRLCPYHTLSRPPLLLHCITCEQREIHLSHIINDSYDGQTQTVCDRYHLSAGSSTMLTISNPGTFTSSSICCDTWLPSPHLSVNAIGSSRRSRDNSVRGMKFAVKDMGGYSRHSCDCSWGRKLVVGVPSFENRWQRHLAGGKGLASSAQLKAVRSENNIPVESGSSEVVSAVRQKASGLVEPIGVVIVDHGSRRKASNNLLDAFVDLYKEETGRQLVEPAHMEISEPSIATAFARCVNRGARTVIISPYFLSPGRHWSQDIPELAASAAENHPGVGYLVAAPIGLHAAVAGVVEERIQRCMSHVSGQSEECHMCAGSGVCQVKMFEKVCPEVSADC